MKKWPIFILTGFLFANSGFANEPENLSIHKAALIRYHDSGEYAKDVEVVIQNSLNYIENEIKSNAYQDKKPAIVLDIDETTLSNFNHLKQLDFGGTSEQIQTMEDIGDDPAIEPTLRLYQYAKAHHIAVFFVTGRTEPERLSTIANLKRVGFHDWDGLYLKPSAYVNAKTAALYKTEVRKKIVSRGFEIIANIGDQQSDLVGGFADKTFKLPNPYYFIA